MNSPEYWLRGPVEGISPLLQPVAHALLQARDEVNALMAEFPDFLLWERPAGLASPGFHLWHLSGVLDRLFTYSDGKALSDGQLADLEAEGTPHKGASFAREGVDRFNLQIDNCLQQLSRVAEGELTQARQVGRARMPSTVIGLLVHAAEHTMRHTGQLLVTARILGSRDWAGNRME